MSLENQVVIVTGGAAGQGASHVRRCVAEGASVVFGDVQADAGEALAAELGDKAVFIEHDVSSEEGWNTIVATAVDRFGGVDGLVNNAGIHHVTMIAEESADRLRRLHEVNVVGPFLGFKAVLPHLQNRGAGSVVNICSLAATQPWPGYTAYAASKWALRGMTHVWAQEHGHENIRVNAILPGAIEETTMYQRPDDPNDFAAAMQGIPLRRPGTPADVSDLVVFLLSAQSAYITGADIPIDGGLSA